MYKRQRIVYSIFRKERAIYVWSTFKHANDIFSGFIIGKTIDSLIIGIICLLGMKLFNIGSSYAVIVSIFVGLTNMIPYFGPFIGAIPSILVISLSCLLYTSIVRGAVCFVNFMILVKKILVDVERCIYETSF